MSDFDPNSYFQKRLAEIGPSKIDAIAKASQAKVDNMRQYVAETEAFQAASAERNKDSWVTELGLDPNGVVGTTVNAGANLFDGIGKIVQAGATSAPILYGAAIDSNVPDAVKTARKNQLDGTATQADLDLLALPAGDTVPNKPMSPYQRLARRDASRQGTLETNLDRIQRLEDTLRATAKVRDTLDSSGVVHRGRQDALVEDLKGSYEANAAQIAQGWEDGGLSGAADMVSGVAGLVGNIVGAAARNPVAAAEYMVSNAPQLAAAAFGGGAGMAATNIPYAIEEFGKGIAAYQAKHGQLPPAKQMQEMAMYATTLVAAESLGDVATLGAGRLGKAVGKGVDDSVTAAFKKALTGSAAARIGTATVGGGAGEFGTEAWQTYAENKIEGKESTGADIYVGGAIGAISGAGMSGGMRTFGEVTSTTPEKVEQRQKAAEQRVVQQAAIATGDVSALTDTEAPTYAPDKAIAALYGNSKQEGVTDKAKFDNYMKAGDIVAELEAKSADFEAKIADASLTDKERKAAALEYKAHKKQVDAAWKAMENFTIESTKDVDVDAAVNEIKAGTPEASAAAEQLINLSMANPDKLGLATVKALADDTSNGLNDSQRTYLREFTAARIAENKLKTGSKVSQEIYLGSRPDAKIPFIGIAQYRSRITQALATNKPELATSQLATLTAFAKDHRGKAGAALEAFDRGIGTQIVKRDGIWEIHTGPKMSESERVKRGALTITNLKFVREMADEATALEQAVKELDAAIAVKTGTPVTQTGTTNNNGATNVSNQPQGQAAQSQATQGTAPVPPAQATATGTAADSTGTTGQPTAQGSATATPAAVTAQPDNVQVTGTQTGSTASVVPDQQTTEATDTADIDGLDIDVDTEPTVAETTSLEVMGKKSPEGTAYKMRNLIADYFNQRADAPMSTTRDFIKTGLDKVFGTLENNQQAVITKFRALAADWGKTFEANLKRKPQQEFWYQDMMQFLIQEGVDGALALEDNVKTAMSYAAFSWLAENASRPASNSDAEINAILGRDEDTFVSYDEQVALRDAGTRQNLVVNALGQRAIAALGLKASKDAPKNLSPQLESVVGAHVLKMMIDRGLVDRKPLSGQAMARLYGDKAASTDQGADFNFIKLARNENGKLNDTVQDIYDTARGTGSVIDKVFKVDAGLKEPTLEPVEFTQTKTRNTNQAVPEKLAEALREKNKEANYLRQDMWNLVAGLDNDIVMELAGAQHIDNTVHAVNADAIEAKNDGLQREIDRLFDFVNNTLFRSKESLDSPMYFEHNAWKQQRVGISTNAVNPQTSKIHRHLLYRSAWETKVDTTNAKQMDDFFLRVGEGLGVKTDKQANDRSLEAVLAKLEDAKIKAAIKVLQASIAGEELTAAQQQTLLDGVKAGGENFHSLDALMAMAHYHNAGEAGLTSFTTHLMGEVDGVTNGPMLSHLLLGAADSAKALFNLLKRGGFFPQGSGFSNYNIWRGTPGNFDLYETTAAGMNVAVQEALQNGETAIKMLGKAAPKDPEQAKARLGQVFNALYTFTGTLVDKDGKVEKAGRNIVKTPLTAMVFGSSVKNSVNSMADKFIESIYAKIEDVAKGKADLKETVEHLNFLLSQAGAPMINPNITIGQLMTYDLSKDNDGRQHKALKRLFDATLGEAVKTTMKDNFAQFMDRRTVVNQAAQTAFTLYNAAYAGLKKQFIADIIKEVDGKGKPIRALTAAEDKQLRDRLKKLTPVLHTLMSKDSKQLSAGLYMAKTKRGLSRNDTFGSQTLFNGGSMRVNGFEVMETNPGVGMAVMSIHSTDSAISHYAGMGNEVLNVHDAHGAGVGNFEQTARNLNQATWNAMLNYSPATEMYNGLARTIAGLHGLLSDASTPAEVKQEVAISLMQLSADLKDEGGTDSFLTRMATAAKDAAYQADKIKFETLAQLESVDQYALEGGNYAVTDADRAEAVKRGQELKQGLPTYLTKMLADIDTMLEDEMNRALDGHSTDTGTEAGTDLNEDEGDPRTPPSKGWDEVGTPSIASDAGLVAFFEANQTPTVAQVIEQLRGQLQAQPQTKIRNFNLALLEQLGKVASADLSIRYVTPTNQGSSVLDAPKENSRGWFVVNGNASAIHVLSPAFKHSGLTVETLLHELTHSVTAQLVEAELAKKRANPDYTSDVLTMVQELETLRSRAQDKVANDSSLSHLASAVSNVHELMAWGMSNQEFQRKVLNQITMQSKTKKLMNGMRAFYDAVVGILFGGSDKSRQAIAVNGMAVLIGNVAGLLDQAAKLDKATKAKTDAQINFSQAATTILRDYSTLDIHHALADGSISGAFDTHLQNLLGGLVERLHGPFGSLKAALMKDQAISPLDVWLKAKNTGAVPFASAALAQVGMGQQEAFAIEQIEATVRSALDSSEAPARTAYKELSKLYDEAKKALKPSDFASQAEYDLLFKPATSTGERSEYLARFAALALGHERINGLMGFDTAVNPQSAPKSFAARMQNWFENLLAFFTTKITGTYAGQKGNEKLQTLVAQLVDIEAKRRHTLLRKANEFNVFEPIENAAVEVVDAAKAKIEQWAGANWIRQSKIGAVRGAGAVARTLAGNRVDVFMAGLKEFREKHLGNQQTLTASLINEFKGPLEKFQALLRFAKNNERIRKQIITSTAKSALTMFKNGGKDLSKQDKAALTAVFLRTGLHHLVDHYSMAEIQRLMDSPEALNKAMSDFEGQLQGDPKLVGYYIRQANALGYFKATGRVRSEHLMMNAHNIANLYGTDSRYKVPTAQAAQAEETLNVLVSLYALGYVNVEHKTNAARVLNAENNRSDDGNGAEFLLKLHKHLEEDAKARLFAGKPSLMMHGYTPEILNPHIEAKVADEEEGKLLVEQGYVKGAPVPQDHNDPEKRSKHIYVLKDGGLAPYLSAITSFTGKQAKGSKKHNGWMNVNTEHGLENAQLQAAIMNNKVNAINSMFTALPSGGRPNLASVQQTFMAPVVDTRGFVVNYRYMMEEGTKDNLLQRTNDFDQVLGTLAGSVFDKEATRDQNKQMIKAVKEQYDAEYAERPDMYVLVGAKSTDPALREIWDMLPDDTKTDVRSAWGRDGMYVRADLLDITFGYRKQSLANLWDMDAEDRGHMGRFFTGFVEHLLTGWARSKGQSQAEAEIFAKQAALRVRQGENIWQEIVRETKDIFVVKTGTVMLGNIISNWSLLWLNGVSIKDMAHHHYVALKGATAYQKDSAELAHLQRLVETGLVGSNPAEIEERIIRLRDSLDRNPVKELIDAGLMPTIVEDVAADDDPYSYKSQFVRKMEGVTSKLNDKVLDAAKVVYMAHDTKLYQGLNRITQLSDFVARYTLYKHLTERKKNPLNREAAIQEASDAFVNYDIPMHRTLQYTDDMGLTMFTKYFMRIQKVLLKVAKEHPARTMSMILLNHYLDLGSIVLDSSAVAHLGNNPLNWGAFQYPFALDELGTVSGAMALIK